jgi:hypothetical protein
VYICELHEMEHFMSQDHMNPVSRTLRSRVKLGIDHHEAPALALAGRDGQPFASESGLEVDVRPCIRTTLVTPGSPKWAQANVRAAIRDAPKGVCVEGQRRVRNVRDQLDIVRHPVSIAI